MNAFPAVQLSDVLTRARRPVAAAPLTRERWAQIPLTTKDTLRAAYPFGLLAVESERIATYHESSGTSGQPIASYFTDADWEDVQTRFLRSDVKLGPADRVLIKTPYALVTTAHQMHGAARRAGAMVIPADNRSLNMPYARVLRLLRDLEVSVAWCLPTEALLWANLARRAGLDPARDFPKLRAFLVAGEALSPARKRAIARAWGGKRVIEDYGSTETGSLAGECARGQLHFWSDRVYGEVVGGSLVVTPLFREAMPLIRYDLGDQVRLGECACPCGSALPTLEVLGRRGATSTRAMEETIYTAGERYGLWFWRARWLRTDTLQLEICVQTAETSRAEATITQALVASGAASSIETRAVAATEFLPDLALSPEVQMQKPRFVFAEGEDWNRSLAYA